MPANPDTEGRLGEQDKALGGLILNVGGSLESFMREKARSEFHFSLPKGQTRTRGQEGRCLSGDHGRTDACFELNASYIPIPPRFVAFHL